MFLTASPFSYYIEARALLSGLPNLKGLLGDRGYDADWFRKALHDNKICPCSPGWKKRKTPVRYDKRGYKRHNPIKIMFGKLKDWRRVATRYDPCPQTYFSAIAITPTVIFRLSVRTTPGPGLIFECRFPESP